MYSVPVHAKQLSLTLDDQEEEPPQGGTPVAARPVSHADRPKIKPAADAQARPRALRMSPACRAFRRAFFPQSTDAQWSDWRWQVQNRIRDLATVRRMVRLTTEEEKADRKSVV